MYRTESEPALSFSTLPNQKAILPTVKHYFHLLSYLFIMIHYDYFQLFIYYLWDNIELFF